MIYGNKIKAGIGKVTLSTSVDNSFPIVGETVLLQTGTKWAQQMRFDIVKAAGQTERVDRDNTSQMESIGIPIVSGGDLIQAITAKNSISTSVVKQLIMAMEAQALPYFNVTAQEIARVGESGFLRVTMENGYNGACDISVRVYRENETVAYKTLPPAGRPTPDSQYPFSYYFAEASERGIYDVEVDVTDAVSGVTFTKRINKLISITPRLAARPTQEQIDNNDYTEIIADKNYGVSLKMYETGANDLYCVFVLKEGQTNYSTGYYAALDISKIPAGKDAYTFVLEPDGSKGKYYSRILLTGATDIKKSNANGTPQFSHDVPLVFTIDRETPLTIWGVYYNTVSYSGCIWNTVWDGRGYYNLEKGIKFDRYSNDLYWEDAFMLLNGTSDVELFEIEICNTGFTAIASKTDPTAANPWFWYGNFEEKNFIWHHSHIHDTTGEGYYIGYFTASKKTAVYTGATTTFKNLAGESVTYVNGNQYDMRAHSMEKVRIYRNKLERLGYDGMQLANARHSEVCYNTVDFGGMRNDADQASGMSLQSMDGRVYNNVITNYNGPGMQLGPMTDLEIFNNIVDGNDSTDAIQFLFELENPDHNPTGGGSGTINETTLVKVHNNVLIAGRFTANGRNTVQMRSVFFTDNILVNNGQNFANMATETLQVWNANMQGNAVYNKKDFLEKLQDLKIADRNNSDFRIGYNSGLAKGGVGTYFQFDFRGYKNWYSNIFPSGAYMGVYRNPDFYVDALNLLTLSVNDGAAEVGERTVTVKFTYAGVPTKYRISETEDFSGAEWMLLTSMETEYIISREFGTKTIYFQLANVTEESNTMSVSFEYIRLSLTLDELVLNDGKLIAGKLDIPVSFRYGGSVEPVKYRVGEAANLSDAVWADMAEGIIYTFKDMGQKTLYGQLRDADGNDTEIKSASISIEQSAMKAIISLGWKNTEISSAADGYYDAETGITRFQSQADITVPRPIWDMLGELLGTAVPSSYAVNMITQSGAEGTMTGDNSGAYPDEYLRHNSAVGGNAVISESITFTIPAGTYKVRVLANTKWNQRVIPNEALLYKAVTDMDEKTIILPESGVQGNTANMTDPVTVAVGDSGMLKIDFGIGVAGTYYYAPINIIEIEKI